MLVNVGGELVSITIPVPVPEPVDTEDIGPPGTEVVDAETVLVEVDVDVGLLAVEEGEEVVIAGVEMTIELDEAGEAVDVTVWDEDAEVADAVEVTVVETAFAVTQEHTACAAVRTCSAVAPQEPITQFSAPLRTDVTCRALAQRQE